MKSSPVLISIFYRYFRSTSNFTQDLKIFSHLRNRVFCYTYIGYLTYLHLLNQIGHTTNALATRVRQHRYRQSSIHAHLQSDHQQAPPPYDQFIAQFKIMHSFPVTIDLKIAESLCIKTNNPFSNIKYNELSSFLKLF